MLINVPIKKNCSVSYCCPKKQFGPQNNQLLAQLQKLMVFFFLNKKKKNSEVNRLTILTKIFIIISYQNVVN